MPDPVIIRQDVLPKTGFGGHDRVVASKTAARPGEVDHTGYELWVARRAFDLLEAAYPGYAWFVDCDLEKGGVCIALPVLMGGNWVYFINMKDMEPARVLAAGGELLERYRLPRSRFELGRFLEARAKHSILTGAAKKVPE